MRTRLFVYGTLLAGEDNHRLLRGAERLGPARTEPRFRMVDFGEYPAIVADGATPIEGELYDVDDATLARLDRFEGHPQLYTRTTIALEGIGGARAEAYLLQASQVAGRPLIASGSWRGVADRSGGSPSEARDRRRRGERG